MKGKGIKSNRNELPPQIKTKGNPDLRSTKISTHVKCFAQSRIQFLQSRRCLDLTMNLLISEDNFDPEGT
jgi:hypothetical protein